MSPSHQSRSKFEFKSQFGFSLCFPGRSPFIFFFPGPEPISSSLSQLISFFLSPWPSQPTSPSPLPPSTLPLCVASALPPEGVTPTPACPHATHVTSPYGNHWHHRAASISSISPHHRCAITKPKPSPPSMPLSPRLLLCSSRAYLRSIAAALPSSSFCLKPQPLPHRPFVLPLQLSHRFARSAASVSLVANPLACSCASVRGTFPLCQYDPCLSRRVVFFFRPGHRLPIAPEHLRPRHHHQ